MLKIINADLVEIHKQGNTIMHGCNCMKQWGLVGGIARILFNKFPQINDIDVEVELGGYNDFKTEYGTIINAYTQYNCGANFDIFALQCVIYDLEHEYCVGDDIYIPAIGCGIGGGNWQQICKVFANSKINFIMCLI